MYIPWFPKNESELLAGQSHCRGINDGSHFLNILSDDFEEETFIAVLQGSQVDVLVQAIVPVSDIC